MSRNTSIAIGVVVIILLIIGVVLALRNDDTSMTSVPTASPTAVSTLQPTAATTPQTTATSQSVVTATPTPQATAANLTVTYTNSGFTPNNLEIQKGQTVTFVNNSSGNMWIGSNPHPTHTIYPQFDAKTNMAPGQSYSFTFDRVGSWGYHNHSSSSHGGTIVVK